MVSKEFYRRAALAALVLVVMGGTACGEKVEAGDQGPPGAAGAALVTETPAVPSAAPTAALTPQTQQAIDAGNAAIRAKDYMQALVEFEKAASLSPAQPAPWFGIYMVAQARKDSRAADAALAEIRKRGAAPALDAPRIGEAAPAATGGRTGTGVTRN